MQVQEMARTMQNETIKKIVTLQDSMAIQKKEAVIYGLLPFIETMGVGFNYYFLNIFPYTELLLPDKR